MRAVHQGTHSFIHVRRYLVLLLVATPLLQFTFADLRVEVTGLELEAQHSGARSAHRAVAGGANLLCTRLAHRGVEIRRGDQSVVALLQRLDAQLDLGSLLGLGLLVRACMAIGYMLATEAVTSWKTA